MFNVVVVVEWWYPGVLKGFYSVVVLLSVVSNQTRAVSSPRGSTILHVVVACVSKKETDLPVEGDPDHYESVEVANALAPCSDPKIIASAFDLFGKQGTGHTHGFFHVLMTQGFLGSFGNFFFDDVFGFAFDASC